MQRGRTHIRGAPLMRLSGLNAIITGASQGLGKAIATQFLREGANVALCARDAQLLAISFCRQQGSVSKEHLCLGCLGYVLFRTGQWRSAIENARKVLINKDAHPTARATVAVVDGGDPAFVLQFVHAEFDRIGAPRDLVMQLPAPVTRERTFELMREADLVVATGSATNVRGAYESGTPAIGVGVGNVVVIVDETADLADAAAKIARSKTFDNATSCSSENSVVAVQGVADALLAALVREGGMVLEATEAAQLARTMFAGGKLSPDVVAQDVATIAGLAGLTRPGLRDARFLIVTETGVGREHPFSGEKLAPVLAFYRTSDFAASAARAGELLRFQGAGHSIGLHTRTADRARELGLTLPVSRVIVNQAHCFATGGSFDNALPFSLSMGCGTWGGNSISDNLGYRHFLNITRVVRPLAPERVHEPTDDELFGAYRAKHGA